MSRPLGHVMIASIAVVLVVVGILAGTALRVLREGGGASQVASPAGLPTPTVPKAWQLVTAYDLLIPLPPNWQKTVDTLADPPRPDAPRILYFADASPDRASNREVSIWIWPSDSVDRLVRERFVVGNLSHISDENVAASRPMREVIGVASWSDTRGSGRTRGRSLFVQADAERVVIVTVIGEQVPSTETEPSAEMRTIQDVVAGHIVALADVDRVFAPEQAREAVELALPIDTPPSVVITREGPMHSVYGVHGRADSLVRVFTYRDVGTRRGSTPIEVRSDIPSTPRAIGNLVVWASSPDANVRYMTITALDALLTTAPARTPLWVVWPGFRNGICTTGPVTESARNGDYEFLTDVVDERNEFVSVLKRGARPGDRVGANLVRLDASGWIGLPAMSAEPMGHSEFGFRIPVYKPAGRGCWQVNVQIGGRDVASYVVEVREP